MSDFSIEVQMHDAIRANELFNDFKRMSQLEDEIEQTSSNSYDLREDLQEDSDFIDEYWNEFLLFFEENNVSLY